MLLERTITLWGRCSQGRLSVGVCEFERYIASSLRFLYCNFDKVDLYPDVHAPEVGELLEI